MKLPAMQEELLSGGIRLVTPVGTNSVEVVGTKAVRSVDDMQNLLLRSGGGPMAAQLADLGATVISMPSSEVYDALSKGTIEAAALTYPNNIVELDIHSVADYVSLVGLGCVGYLVCIGEDTWQSLDPRAQKIMEEQAALLPEKYIELYTAENEEFYAAIAAAGVETITLPAAEKAKIRAAGQKQWNIWVDNMEGKGLPGAEVFQTFMFAVEKYS